MSNFALDVNTSQGDIISSLNYALANLGNNTTANTANVLTANTGTGQITTNGNVVAYLYQYMNVAYGNSATGSGFTSNSYNTTYYGVHNNQANVADTNPADYQWTQVAGGFGTTKHLYYQTLGGRQINFNVNTTALPYYTAVQDNTPINLDIVTGTTGANGAPGANGVSGVSTYNFPVYLWANSAPRTPETNTGSWNFTTGMGTPPLDIYGNINAQYNYIDPAATIAWNNVTNSNLVTYTNTINGNTTALTYNFNTVTQNNYARGVLSGPINVQYQYASSPGTPQIYHWANLTVSGGTAYVDLLLVGAGGMGDSLGNISSTHIKQYAGGSGGNVTIASNVAFSPGTYTVYLGGGTIFGVGSNVTQSGPQPYQGVSYSGALTGISQVDQPLYAAYYATPGTAGTVIEKKITANNAYPVTGYGAYSGTYTPTPGNQYSIAGNIATPNYIYDDYLTYYVGANGVPDPWNQISWVGDIQSNGVAFFGGAGGAGGGSYSDPAAAGRGQAHGGLGGGGLGSSYNYPSNTIQSTNATLGTGGGGGGGANLTNPGYGYGAQAYGSPGVAVIRQNQLPTTSYTWSTTIPASPGYGNLYVSYAYAQIQGNVGNTSVLTWSTPQSISGPRGIFTSAYVVTASDPTFYTTDQFTTAFSAPRGNVTPPIGTGFTPLNGDTATFTYRPTNTITTRSYNASVNSWLFANSQVISGNLFVSNSVTASALITTDVYPLNITSQNATFGSYASPGFWMAASNGNARFGGTMSIGNSLTVGNNAVIGNSLLIGNNTIIGSSLAVGNNASIGNNLVVGNNTLVGNSMIIGDNLLVGNNASIGNNLIVGNNAVIGGNLSITGLVTGGNLRANVVNNINIAYGAVGSNQIQALSIGSALLQTGSLISRLFAANSIPGSAFTPNSIPSSALGPGVAGSNIQLAAVNNFSTTTINSPVASKVYYVTGGNISIRANIGDQFQATGNFFDNLQFASDPSPGDTYRLKERIEMFNPDGSSNDFFGIDAPYTYWSDNGYASINPAPVPTVAGAQFTATQQGNVTFAMGISYSILSGSSPTQLNCEGSTMTIIQKIKQ